MDITLYLCTAPANEVLKTKYLYKKKKITGCVIKDDCSILEPHITLRSFDGALKYNYCYISDFERYYYIDDMITTMGGMLELVCSVDPLYSFAKDLGNCIIQERRATAGEGAYIADDKVIMNASPQIRVIDGFGDLGFFKTESFLANIFAKLYVHVSSLGSKATEGSNADPTNVVQAVMKYIGWRYAPEEYGGYNGALRMIDCSQLVKRAFDDTNNSLALVGTGRLSERIGNGFKTFSTPAEYDYRYSGFKWSYNPAEITTATSIETFLHPGNVLWYNRDAHHVAIISRAVDTEFEGDLIGKTYYLIESGSNGVIERKFLEYDPNKSGAEQFDWHSYEYAHLSYTCVPWFNISMGG